MGLRKRLPALFEWAFWSCVVVMSGFTAGYYFFIMNQLYFYQEVNIFEFDPVMNVIELGIAIFSLVLVAAAVIFQVVRLVKIIREKGSNFYELYQSWNDRKSI